MTDDVVDFSSTENVENGSTNLDILEEMGYGDAVVFNSPSYDDAIIGVSEDGRVVYDYDKMIEYLMKNEGMTLEQSVDFISYDTIRSTNYVENPPIVMYSLWMR